MTVTAAPAMAQAVGLVSAVCTAAKTTYSDNTNAVLLLTPGANGSLVTRLGAMPRATVTVTQLQLYSTPDGGTTMNLIGSGVMAAYTLAQTTLIPQTAILDANGVPYSETNPLYVPSGTTLYAAIGVALAGGVVFTANKQDL